MKTERKRPIWVGFFIFLAIVGVTFAVILGLSVLLGKKDYLGAEKIAIVRVEGVIFNSKEIISQLKKYQSNPTVKAIVLRVNSPGGGVGPAQEIHELIRQIARKKEKKILVSMGSVAASGGYYIACPAEKIVANPGTITGSIGVIMEFPNIQELFKKVGLDTVVVKSGKFKDIGSPIRTMSEEEKRLLQGMIDDVYTQFVRAVAEGRNLPVERVRKLADGRIFSGKQAKEFGLVDELGGLEHTVQLAAKLTGLEKKAFIRLEEKERFNLSELLNGISRIFGLVGMSESTISLQYRWK
jgi:protease-4